MIFILFTLSVFSLCGGDPYNVAEDVCDNGRPLGRVDAGVCVDSVRVVTEILCKKTLCENLELCLDDAVCEKIQPAVIDFLRSTIDAEEGCDSMFRQQCTAKVTESFETMKEHIAAIKCTISSKIFDDKLKLSYGYALGCLARIMSFVSIAQDVRTGEMSLDTLKKQCARNDHDVEASYLESFSEGAFKKQLEEQMALLQRMSLDTLKKQCARNDHDVEASYGVLLGEGI